MPLWYDDTPKEQWLLLFSTRNDYYLNEKPLMLMRVIVNTCLHFWSWYTVFLCSSLFRRVDFEVFIFLIDIESQAWCTAVALKWDTFRCYCENIRIGFEFFFMGCMYYCIRNWKQFFLNMRSFNILTTRWFYRSENTR